MIYLDFRIASSLLFPEYEIVIEAEPSKNDRTNKDNENELHKYEQYLEKNKDTPLDKQLEKDLKKVDEKKTDEYFQKFKERIAVGPDQVSYKKKRYVLVKAFLKMSHFKGKSDEEITKTT